MLFLCDGFVRYFMKITCIGSGVFGISIAHLLAQKPDYQVTIWSHDKNFVSQCQKKKKLLVKDQFELDLPNNISLTTSYDEALENAEIIFLLINSKYFFDVINELRYYHLKNKVIFIGTKGMLSIPPYYLTLCAKKFLKCKKIAYFAGPNFAHDLIELHPALFTLATKNKSLYKIFKSIFPSMRVEPIKCVESLELASVLKNIYAIGAGLIYAKYPSSSSIVSYSSFAFQEMCTLIEQTLSTSHVGDIKGILGDFFLTNMNNESRNFSFGMARYHSSNDASNYLKKNTVEGYDNLENIVHYLGKNIKYYPIFYTIYDIIYKNKKADTLIDICFKRS